MKLKKLLDFQASISDVKQANPLFSTCKVRILYTGRNRNMSIITKDSVEKALPTLKNIPIVGEFSYENEDYKGHGGAVNLDSSKYIHTTKPYGVVPESATYDWEEVKSTDGSIREYLTISGCYLWTGRYEEAYSIVEKGKGQSMEIEVTDGRWLEEDEAYQIDNFIFSALCILGDDVEPAFEDANITAYSLDKDSFKQEFSKLLNELKSSLSNEEEDNKMLKKLLEKYSLKMEDLTAKGIDLTEISEDELEAKIIEVFEIDKTNSEDKGSSEDENLEDELDNQDNLEGEQNLTDDENTEDQPIDFETRVKELEDELTTANGTIKALTSEVGDLKEFKLNVEKSEHEAKSNKIFSDFQLSEEDTKDLDIHAFSLDEIEEKCYAILGRKMASKKSFAKDENIKLPIGNNENKDNEQPVRYGGLLNKNKK